MALVLIATPAAADANSYATAAEGDAYHLARLFSTAWTGASTATKEAALVWATRLLDGTIEWTGFATTNEQALAWPRSGMFDRNQRQFIGDHVIPQELKNATAELARQLIVADRTLDSDVETQGLTSLSVGSISLAFRDGVKLKTIPDSIWALLPSWWIARSGRPLGTRELVRV